MVMKRQPLPWDELKEPVYPSVEGKEKAPWVRPGMWVASIFLLVFGIIKHFYLSSLFGALYLLTLVMQRSVVATSRGLEIFNQMYITKFYERWEWSEIDSITYEFSLKFPGKVLLYFTKGDRTRRAYFQEEVWPEIEAYAKLAHPDMVFYDAKEYRTEPSARPPRQGKSFKGGRKKLKKK